MIFYFSGTGNSIYAAKSIALHNNEELVSISAAVNTGNECFEYSLKDKERIGFVFPIYAWGPPKMVLEFIGKLKLNHYRDNYIFSVATCGGNIGNTMKVMDGRLKKKGMHLNGRFSIKMPNNYILMGDVDSEKVEKEKRLAAEETLKRINPAIEQRTSGEFNLDKGFLAWLLTRFVNPMFNKNAMNTAKFHVNDQCTGCGICEKVCNCNSIHLVNKKPQWGNRCAQCLACIHYCPSKAIQYGKSTEEKGRYTHPEISYHEISMK